MKYKSIILILIPFILISCSIKYTTKNTEEFNNCIGKTTEEILMKFGEPFKENYDNEGFKMMYVHSLYDDDGYYYTVKIIGTDNKVEFVYIDDRMTEKLSWFDQFTNKMRILENIFWLLPLFLILVFAIGGIRNLLDKKKV